MVSAGPCLAPGLGWLEDQPEHLSTHGLSMWVGFLMVRRGFPRGGLWRQSLVRGPGGSLMGFSSPPVIFYWPRWSQSVQNQQEGTQTPPLIGRVPKKSGAMFYNHHTDHMSMTAPKLRDNIQSHKRVRHGVVSHLVGEEGGVAPANPSSLSFQHLESTLPQDRHPGGVPPANSASQMKRSLLSSS